MGIVSSRHTASRCMVSKIILNGILTALLQAICTRMSANLRRQHFNALHIKCQVQRNRLLKKSVDETELTLVRFSVASNEAYKITIQSFAA